MIYCLSKQIRIILFEDFHRNISAQLAVARQTLWRESTGVKTKELTRQRPEKYVTSDPGTGALVLGWSRLGGTLSPDWFLS